MPTICCWLKQNMKYKVLAKTCLVLKIEFFEMENQSEMISPTYRAVNA